MKSGLLKKLLMFILATLLINAVIIVSVFTYSSRNIFANMKAGELVPKAELISSLVAQYQQGGMSMNSLLRLLNTDKSQWDQSFWDATVHIYNEEGEIVITSAMEESETALILSHLAPYVAEVMQGVNTPRVTSSSELGIVVGVPIHGVDAAVTGAVFLTKPLREVNAAMSGLNIALVVSSVAALAVMMLVAYIGSKSITRPLMKMSAASQAMAKGDFTIRADENLKDEIGELGSSLNELSDALSQTIGDLRLERNRLSNVLDGLQEGVIAVDNEGRATHCNSAAYRLLHTDDQNEDAALKALHALWPEIGEEYEQGGQVSSVRPLYGMQLKITLTDLLNHADKRAGVVIMLQDITEEVRLEQTRRDYVANVSHELRTPIASIRSLADALNDGMVKKEDDKQRYYGYILRESMRLSRLINDLLELSRLQSGGVALECRRFDLKPLLIELAERFAVTAGDSGLQFELKIPDDELFVFSNEDRVEQVLVCLLDNAVKYSQDDGIVTLAVEQNKDSLRVSVRNTGNIDPAIMPRLFDRFYKADESHSEEGTGLGLAIAREIMQLLDEKIWAQNIGDEVAFHFTLTKTETD